MFCSIIDIDIEGLPREVVRQRDFVRENAGQLEVKIRAFVRERRGKLRMKPFSGQIAENGTKEKNGVKRSN